MITVEKKRLGFSVNPCVLSLQFEMQIMSHELKRGMCYPSVPRVLCSQCAVAHQRQRIRKAIPAVVGFNGEAVLASPCLSWDPLTLSAPCLFVLLVCAH